MAKLEGYGMFARYRLSKRFEVEVAFDKLRADLGNNRVRELRPVTGSLLWHIVRRGPLGAYLRAGLGKARETYSFDGGSAEFQDKTGHFGAGAEYRMRDGKIGVLVELRSSTVARVFEDGTSWRTQGGQVRLGGVYHF